VTWLLHVLGVDSVADRPYAFFSGSGSVLLPWLMNALTFGAIFYWHHQCTVHGCHRYGRPTAAFGDRACRRHHPAPRRTVEDVHAAHRAAKGQQETR